MIKQLFSVGSDFVILISAAIALFFFKSQMVHVGVWLYELAWVVMIVAVIGTILLKPRKPKVTPVFPRTLAKRIKNALPHDAIKLYQSWFLMSLDQCYQALQKKHSKETLFNFAKIITDKLVSSFNRAPKEGLYKLLEERNKDNAFVALIFFATVIKALKPCAAKSIFKKPTSVYRDVFTYITLENAPHFLFREYYRLYELGALVEGHWVSLDFNSDIESRLRSTLAPELPEAKDQLQTSAPKKMDATHLNESTTIESNAAVPKSQVERLTEQTDKKPSVAQEAVVDGELQHSINTDSIDIERCEKFFKWLKRQMSRKPINIDHYFYQDHKQYGKSVLFITDIALSDFSKKTQIDANEIAEALMSLNHTDGKAYQLNVEGHPNKPLISMAIDFEIKVSSELSGTIEEV